MKLFSIDTWSGVSGVFVFALQFPVFVILFVIFSPKLGNQLLFWLFLACCGFLKQTIINFSDLGPTTPIAGIQNNELAKPSDFTRPTSGWINTVPLSTSTATLSKRSAKSARKVPLSDNFAKCYLKKRNLILKLLAVEIEFLVVWHNPTSR